MTEEENGSTEKASADLEQEQAEEEGRRRKYHSKQRRRKSDEVKAFVADNCSSPDFSDNGGRSRRR